MAGTFRTRQWLIDNYLSRDRKEYNDDLIKSLGLGAAFIGDSSVFYVDPTNGSDTANDGQSPTEAYATLQKAINQCTANKGDVIVRMQGTETITTAINVNKAGIMIVGMAYGQNPWQPEKFSTYPSGAMTGPSMIVSQPCTILGLEVVGRNLVPGYIDDMSTSGAAVAILGEGGGYTGGFMELGYCRFVDWWGNAYGVEFGAGAYNYIHHCVFEGYDAGVYFRSTTSNNPDHNQIHTNRFIDCVNGIEHRAGSAPHNFDYFDNYFVDISGASIDTTGGLGDGLIRGNWYETAAGATYDAAVAVLQAAGINFCGNNYTE